MSLVEHKEDVCKERRLEIKWLNILNITVIHILGCYGLYLFMFAAKWQTMLAVYFFSIISGMGITVGSHRLWAHRAYKATLPLRVLLMLFHTMALQTDVYAWVRDHRMHHKYSETDADPHNSNRGMFFAHVGWLMCKKHPDITTKGHNIDMSDILADPVIRFQRRFYVPLGIICWFFLPTIVPVYLWAETPWNAMFACVFFRYVFVLNSTWSVNSLAHLIGPQHYDKSMNARQNPLVVYLTWGEGYHNFHHAFPSDYSTSELGWQVNFNFSTFFIEFFALLGWAYDLKRTSRAMIEKRVERTGDTALHNLKRAESTLKSFVIFILSLAFPFIFRSVVLDNFC